MRVPIGVFFAICISPIILGSPLGLKNEDEENSSLESPLTPRHGIKIMTSEPHYGSLIHRKRIEYSDQLPGKYKNRRTTTNKSEAVGVTEIYMPKSRYLSRGYTPVIIYYAPDPADNESSTQQAFADGFVTGARDSDSQQEDEIQSRSSSKEENAFEEGEKDTNKDRKVLQPEENAEEKLGSGSDYNDSDDENEDFEYGDDSEYPDGPEDEYTNTDSELRTTGVAQKHGQNRKVCVHFKSNPNWGFQKHPQPHRQREYPNQDHYGQNYNSHYREYRTNSGYRRYPSSGDYRHYSDPRYQRHLTNANNKEYTDRGNPVHYRGYQGSYPSPGYPGPYGGYQGPHLHNDNQGSHHGRGYQGHPYQGYKGQHFDNYRSSQGPYRGYQGTHPRGYQGPHFDDYQNRRPDHIGSLPHRDLQGNFPDRIEGDPNFDHDKANFGRAGTNTEGVADSSVQDEDYKEGKDVSSGEGDSEFSDTEYYDDEEEGPEFDDESEDESDKPEIPLQSDITFESNEKLQNLRGKVPANTVDGKNEHSLDLDYLNDESTDPKKIVPNESSTDNESKNSVVVIKKCIKMQNDENSFKNLTDTTVLSDCISETVEGNKTGRLLDIFTRTNISVECTTPKNESGHCKSFTECPIGNIMNNYNLFLQYMCLRGVFVGVCCPENPALEISDSDDNSTIDSPLEIEQPPEGCGLTQKTRIVGGTISAPHEWTWMVALMRRNRFFCGGVIINNWYILTAAHCVLGVNVKDLKVRLGEYNFMERTEHQHDINVAEIKRHAMFVTATFQHDIALLKLKRRIEYSKFVGSICLPDTNARSYSDDKATVVGWGTVSFGGAASPILRQVTVPVWDNEDCDKTYFLERIDDSFLCAGSTENGEDACQGDSGGPLMTLNSDNRWEVIGIVSWGRRCGDPTYPGVYTRVTSYLDWIAAHAK